MTIPPFTISAKAVNLVSEISSLLTRHDICLEREIDLRLRKANRVKTIHASLAIEGNTLTEDEVSDIINGKAIVAPFRQIQEVKNAIKTYDQYTSLNPFFEKDLLKAHSVMMRSLTDDAGRYRTKSVGVFSESGLVHMAPPPQMVPTLMGDLFEWLKKAPDHLLIKSCVFHYEFEFIHPFSDGNGRMGRLWQSLILGQLSPIFESLPIENIVFQQQERYYNAIAESTERTDSAPFIEFMLEQISVSIKSLTYNKVTDKMTDKMTDKNTLKVLQLIAADPTITIPEMAKAADLSETTLKKIIKSLRDNGRIQRRGSRKNGEWILVG